MVELWSMPDLPPKVKLSVLRLALIGRYMDAARLGAYAERLRSATNQPPALYAQRLRARLRAILQEHIEAQSLDRLFEEGAVD